MTYTDAMETRLEEANSILITVKIQYEQRGSLTPREQEVLSTINLWLDEFSELENSY
jgi:hypothetical protein